MKPPGTPLPDWLAWLETLSPSEIDLGLERVQLMLRRLSPEIPEHVLLIAGTNGKGSSVAMCAALLRATGKRVGAYSSPHLIRYNERIVVDGSEASDASIVAAFERIEAHRLGLPLTYFEYGTLAAIEIFAAANLDVWILEVGLGGRLDATNAIDPSASLITNISLDHCDWLGDTIEAIAAEKAGVMRPNTPCVFGDRMIPESIVSLAAEQGAHLLLPDRDFNADINDDGSWNWWGPDKSLNALRVPGLSGDNQVANAAAVLTLLAAAGLNAGLNIAVINKTLANLTLTGRTQRLSVDGQDYVLDVAHNPAAAAALANTLRSDAHPGAILAIIGLLDDKDVTGVIDALRASVGRWISTTPESHRAIPAKELARQIANLNDSACVVSRGLRDALEYSRQNAEENDRILVTGSFHAVGPALACLGFDSNSKT